MMMLQMRMMHFFGAVSLSFFFVTCLVLLVDWAAIPALTPLITRAILHQPSLSCPPTLLPAIATQLKRVLQDWRKR